MIKEQLTLEQQILMAKGKNWARIITEKCDRITEEHKDDVDLFLQILNGDIFAMAQDEFAMEKQLGYYDEMNMPVECNL